MKKVCITMFLIWAALVSYSQARLGSPANEIKSEFWESEYKLKSGYDDNGDYYIQIQTERATVLYYFSENKICTSTFIFPDNQGTLNYYVELYNKQYVVLSSKTWKMYSEAGICNIELFYPKSGGYCFVWTVGS